MIRIFIAATALAALTSGSYAAVSDETCEGSKDLCRVVLKCSGPNKCMQDTNLDGKWGCVACSNSGGSFTTKDGGGDGPSTRIQKPAR